MTGYNSISGFTCFNVLLFFPGIPQGLTDNNYSFSILDFIFLFGVKLQTFDSCQNVYATSFIMYVTILSIFFPITLPFDQLHIFPCKITEDWLIFLDDSYFYYTKAFMTSVFNYHWPNKLFKLFLVTVMNDEPIHSFSF